MESRSIWAFHAGAAAGAGVGFHHAGMRFQAMAFASPLRSHALPHLPPRVGSAPSPRETAGASSPIRRSRRRQPSCRAYSSLFDSADGLGGGDDEDKADGVPEGTPSSSDSSNDDDGAAAAAREPRADEQVTDILADAAASGTVDPPAAAAAAAGEEQVDWDKAWASTRQRMEKEKKAAPAFSGRKQVVASKNAEGGYDFEEISADGSSRMRGDTGSGGFGFADGGQVEDGPGRVRRQEQEAVNLATTNQAFAGLFVVLLASLIFEVYVYMSGGITNGSTRFQNIGQPTTYDALPLPPSPPPADDLTV